MHSDETRGFTLVEALILLAILTILMAILIPTIVGARHRADRTVCIGHLKQLGTLAMTYAEDHGGWFPLALGPSPRACESLQFIADENQLRSDLFVCPASDDRPAGGTKYEYRLTSESCSYAWIGQPTSSKDSSILPLGSDDSIRGVRPGVEGNHRGGVNAVYVGMYAEWIPLEDLPESGLMVGLVDNSGQRGD